MEKHARRFALVSALALAASCSPASDPASIETQADVMRGTEASREFGEYIVHVNALVTNQLAPEIASEYGIVRSGNRAMLTVSILKKQQSALAQAVRAEVTSSAVNLTGQVKRVLLREIAEEDAIYYIGEVDVNEGETLTYTIEAIPADEQDRLLSLRYQKQFFPAL